MIFEAAIVQPSIQSMLTHYTQYDHVPAMVVIDLAGFTWWWWCLKASGEGEDDGEPAGGVG